MSNTYVHAPIALQVTYCILWNLPVSWWTLTFLHQIQFQELSPAIEIVCNTKNARVTSSGGDKNHTTSKPLLCHWGKQWLGSYKKNLGDGWDGPVWQPGVHTCMDQFQSRWSNLGLTACSSYAVFVSSSYTDLVLWSKCTKEGKNL